MTLKGAESILDIRGPNRKLNKGLPRQPFNLVPHRGSLVEEEYIIKII